VFKCKKQPFGVFFYELTGTIYERLKQKGLILANNEK